MLNYGIIWILRFTYKQAKGKLYSKPVWVNVALQGTELLSAGVLWYLHPSTFDEPEAFTTKP